MSINIGSISAKDIYIGSIPAKEIRLGSDLIWSRVVEPEVYYTLTVNLEGESEAFEEGYRIYVDDDEKYRAYAYDSSVHSFSIPSRSSISTVMEPYYIHGRYSYSETITPTPDSPWIMDKDYSVTIVAERNVYTLTVDYGAGVDYVDIYYKQPYESEFTWIHKVWQVELMPESQYYIVPSLIDGYVLDLDQTYGLGTAENPETLNQNTEITIYTTSTTADNEYELHINNDSYIKINSIEVKIGGNVVHSQTDYTNGINNVSITHNGNEPVEVNIGTFGSIYDSYWSGACQPQVDDNTFLWDTLPESGVLTVSISSS